MEGLYVNGRPRHHLESAHRVDVDPNDSELSSIFVVDAETFRDMDGDAIRTIFQERHILVTDVDTEDMAFNLAGLSTVGPLHRPRTMQRKEGQSYLDYI